MDCYHRERNVMQSFNRLYNKTSLKYNTTMNEFEALGYNITDVIIVNVLLFVKGTAVWDIRK
jgi:hypothetical protein